MAEQATSLKQLQDSIGQDIRRLHASLETRIRQRVEESERRERTTGVLIIALSVLAIAVELLATGWSFRTLRPVKTLIEGVSRIGQGDYSAQLGVRGDDEISLLAREFDAMARSLREREAQLKEKQEALLRAEQLAAAAGSPRRSPMRFETRCPPPASTSSCSRTPWPAPSSAATPRRPR